MGNNPLRLPPGTLWRAIERRTRHALACGALQPIRTEQMFLEDGGVRFMVRMIPSLVRKNMDSKRQRAEQQTGRTVDPFLPYDEALFVADVSDTHLCLLNKFNVIDHHVLIVTRHFEDQETLLTLEDFQALWACMVQHDSLGFYNGGAIAGASQPHKHLQLVPLPLAEAGPAIPIEPLLRAVQVRDGIGTIPGFPFQHAWAAVDAPIAQSPLTTAKLLKSSYRELLYAVGLHPVPARDERRQSGPYNLLLTRKWMLLVPRTREFLDAVSINALGFAGSLFVRNPTELATIQAHGPRGVLQAVARARR